MYRKEHFISIFVFSVIGRVDIYIKLSIIIGARSLRPLINVGWKTQAIWVE